VLWAEKLYLPGPTSHPMLHRAFAEARKPITAYRMRYSMPPNDPRLLSMTEGDILFDLLTSMYFEHERRKLDDPNAVVEEAQQRGNLRQVYEDLEKDFTSGKMQEAIQRFEAARAGRADAPRRIVSIQPGVIVGG
jgi:hypothetical protein